MPIFTEFWRKKLSATKQELGFILRLFVVPDGRIVLTILSGWPFLRIGWRENTNYWKELHA